MNGYIHEHEVHDYIKAHGVNPIGIDSVLPIQVNKRDTCNSYYDGSSINFFKSGGGCLNSAYDTLIFHEYGHFIDDSIGGITDGALSEGWGDIMAMYVSGQPSFGEGFFGTPGSEIRDGVNNYIYHAGDEVHTEGQAWMGFAWDLRTNLIAALGRVQGIALAENLVLPVFWANSHDIPSAVREVALRDSPDGDPTHGPHFTQLIAAAGHHGLSYAIVPTLPSINISSPANNSVVSGMVTVSGTASDNQRVASVRISDGVHDLGLATGTTIWTYQLDTTLINNGAFSLSATAVNDAGLQAAARVNLTISNSGQARYDPILMVPSCTDKLSACDSGVLLNGRGSMTGGSEPNQPNTLFNSCPDGTTGTYHADESNDRIRVSTLDGQPFAAGKTIRIESTVWAYANFALDSLDLYYTGNANSPNWIFAGTLRPSMPGSQVLSTTYTLPSGSLQAVRASFRYGGGPSSCSGGGYDDHDDLAFAVAASVPVALNAPTSVAFSNATSSSLNLSWIAAATGYRIDVATDPSFFSFLPSYQNLDVGSALGRQISGLRPSTAYYARVRAYDAVGNTSPNSFTASGVTLQVPTSAVPTILSTSTATGTAGSYFTYSIQATNGPTSFGAAGLPPALSINQATGLISGVPSVAGASNILLSATNASGTGTRSLLLTIATATGPASPTAAFTVTPPSGLGPLTVTIDASGSVGGNLTYGWNFGDFSGAWGKTVTHTFTNPGVYGITLTVANDLGVDHIQKTVTVN